MYNEFSCTFACSKICLKPSACLAWVTYIKLYYTHVSITAARGWECQLDNIDAARGWECQLDNIRDRK